MTINEQVGEALKLLREIVQVHVVLGRLLNVLNVDGFKFHADVRLYTLSLLLLNNLLEGLDLFLELRDQLQEVPGVLVRGLQRVRLGG